MAEEGRDNGRRVISATDPDVTFHADANAQLVPQPKRVNVISSADRNLAKMPTEITKKQSMSNFSQQLEAARYRISHLGPRQQHDASDTAPQTPSNYQEPYAEDAVLASPNAVAEIKEQTVVLQQENLYGCSPASAIAANMRTRPTRLKIKRSINNLTSIALHRKGSKDHTAHKRYPSNDTTGPLKDAFSPLSVASDSPRSDGVYVTDLMPDKAARVFGTKGSRNASGTYKTSPSSARSRKTAALPHSASTISKRSGNRDKDTSSPRKAHGSSRRSSGKPDSSSQTSSRHHEYLDKSLPPTPSSKNAQSRSSSHLVSREATAIHDSPRTPLLQLGTSWSLPATRTASPNDSQEDVRSSHNTVNDEPVQLGKSDDDREVDESDLIDFADEEHQRQSEQYLAVKPDVLLANAESKERLGLEYSPSMYQRDMSPMPAGASPSLVPVPLEVSSPGLCKHSESLEPLLHGSGALSRQASVRSISLGSETAYPMLFDPTTPSKHMRTAPYRLQATSKSAALDSTEVHHASPFGDPSKSAGCVESDANREALASPSSFPEGLLLPQTTYDPTAVRKALKDTGAPTTIPSRVIDASLFSLEKHRKHDDVTVPHTPHLARLLDEVQGHLASQLELAVHRLQEYQTLLYRQFEEKVMHQLAGIEARLTQSAAVQAGRAQETHTPPTTAGSSFASGLAQTGLTRSAQHDSQAALQAPTTPILARHYHGPSSARSSPTSVARAVQAAGHNVEYVNGEMMPASHLQAQGAMQTVVGAGEYWARLGQKQMPLDGVHPALRGA